MLRACLIASVLTVVASLTAQAEPVRVCIHDQTSMPGPARASLRAELVLLFPRLQVVTRSNPCSIHEAGQVVVFVKGSAPSESPDALGRTPVVEGKILPTLEVFVEPVTRLTGANDFETLGRALGRVAGHELLHYLLQETGHQETGLLSEKLGPGTLVAEHRRDLSSQVKSR